MCFRNHDHLVLLCINFHLRQVLDNARSRLAAAIQERSRVLDLICHTLSSTGNTNGTRNSLQRSWTSNNERTSPQNKAPLIDPLGPYTPEVDQALQEAGDARSRSSALRKELGEVIEKTDKMQKMAAKSVNNGLTQKVDETLSLKVSLNLLLVLSLIRFVSIII